MAMQYNPKEIEKKWQNAWEANNPLQADNASLKEKCYVLDMFPYPSADGLHVGHVENYTATDIYSRFKKMNGFEVMHPIGWDAFGLPAENFAIKTGVHPDQKTHENIKNFTRQIKRLGIGYDWSREIDTSSPEYYKWTQWFFLFLYKNGLAYKKKAKVNWCPSCQTVLANEQVVDGRCERCKTEVVQRDLEQWFFKITDFIEDQEFEGRKISGLISGLEKIDWPESTKKAQQNWIGRSEGAMVKFQIAETEEFLEVFTTRVDTIFGCTYVVLAPEHAMLKEKKSSIRNWSEVEHYLEETKKKTELERTELSKDKTGVKLEGIEAINPFTGEVVPVFVADYVLGNYGTGAVMAVPAHDERDFEFAKKYELPLHRVIVGRGKGSIVRSYLMGASIISDEELKNIGILIMERTLDGDRKIVIPSKEFLPAYEDLISQKLDPGFWNEYVGEEVVFIFKHKDGRVERFVLNKENETTIDNLAADFAGSGWVRGSVWRSLAENSWYRNNIIYTEDGKVCESGAFSGRWSDDVRHKMTAELEEKNLGGKKVNYRLRDWLVSRQRYWGAPIPIIYCDTCGEQPVPENELPVILPTDVDFRPTGESPLTRSESFHDVKCPKCGEKARRESDTMDTFVCSSWYYLRFADPKNAEMFADPEKLKKWLPVDMYMGGAEHTVLHLLYARFFTKALRKYGYVEFDEPFLKLRHQGMVLAEDGRKMSKSLGNVVNPDDVVDYFGADALRLYEMFMGPLEDSKSWNTSSIVGQRRFLEKVWKLHNRIAEDIAEEKSIQTILHKTIKKVTEDIESMRFNTAISSLMVLTNEMDKQEKISKHSYATLVLLASPFIPHMAEELWEIIGNAQLIFFEAWPKYDEAYLQDESVEIVVQVNGKLRAKVSMPRGSAQKDVEAKAFEDEKVAAHTKDKTVRKVIFVQDKLMNIVVG